MSGTFTTHDIDRVARLMCEELGVNPDDIVTIGQYDDQTIRDQIHPPTKPIPTYIECGMNGHRAYIPVYNYQPPPDGYRQVARWQTMRPAAEKALASWRAVHKYAMTEM